MLNFGKLFIFDYLINKSGNFIGFNLYIDFKEIGI